MSHSARDVPLDERVQRWCAAVLVALVPWFVAPGRIVPDTKIDLVLTPWRYLGRALDAWNTHTGLGELQNQAYGYIFPMGPFFGLTHSIGVPAWAAQRLWWSLLLVVAFLGAERLARDLGVTRYPVTLLAGFVYALSPRVLTVLSEISVEAWPGALAPWFVVVLLPALRTGATGPDRRRAGIRTGLLCVALGGVNATASAVVVALPLLYLLTAPRRRRRGRVLAWWTTGVVVGSAWWVLPLLVLGRYAYPFMDYIESAATTTAVTSVSNVLRGASHWVAYILTSSDNPVWQSGWVLAQDVTAIVATSAVAGLGLAGLVAQRRRLPHATRFLLLAAILATVAMAIGHAGSGTGPFVGLVQSLLDGALSPLRNVHKADPLLRVPVALGLAALVGSLVERPAQRRGAMADPRAVVAIAGVLGIALAGSVLPVWQGRVGDAWSFERVPAPWRQMAALADSGYQLNGGTTLLLPGSRFADYSWGKPSDEPLSALAHSPVLVRASAPLGHPGATRLLDEIDRLATSGVSQESLSATLQRLGVARVVLRRDLTVTAQAQSWQFVEDVLERSPGLRHVADAGSGDSRLSMYEVTQRLPGPMTTYAAADTVAVSGGGEALPGLIGAGVVTPRTGLELDGTGPPAGSGGRTVATDTERLRAFNAGRPMALAYGPTTTLDDPAVGPSARPDLAITESRNERPHLTLDGLASLTVSSSAADPFSRTPRGPATGPAAALDGDRTTAWVPGNGEARPWLRFGFAEPIALTTVRIDVAKGAEFARVDKVRLVAQGMTRDIPVEADGSILADLAGVRTSSLVLEPIAADVTDDRPVALAEVSIPGHPMRATITVPVRAPDAVVLARDTLARQADATQGEDPASWQRRLAGPLLPGTPQVAALLRPRWGTELDTALDGGLQVTGSSRAGFAPDQRPGAALSDDPTEHWRPADTDRSPSLTITSAEPLHLTTARLEPGTKGTVTLGSPQRGQITLRPGEDTDVSVLSGLTEVRAAFYGLAPGGPAPKIALAGHSMPSRGLEVTCAAPVVVRLGAQDVALSGSWSAAQVRGGAAVPGRACAANTATPANAAGATAAGPSGSLDLAMRAAPTATIDQVALFWRSLPTGATPSRITAVRVDGPGHLRATVTQGQVAVLALAEGANAGWQARTAEGTLLQPISVDGWRQGFLLPAEAHGAVSVDFGPDRTYRAGLVAGGLGAVLLLAAALADVLARRRSQPGALAAWAVSSEPDAATSSASVASSLRRGSRWAGALLAVAAATALAGWLGLLVGLLALVVPRQVRGGAVLGALVASGVAMSVLGVADRHSAGALAGQGLGSFVVAILVLTLSLPASGEQNTAR
jgi:arabinofuranan 3-O-arabinosyltransferase